MTLCALFTPKLQTGVYAQEVVVSYQDFYDQLAPYGQWVGDPQYGNVWVPNEEPGYRPYATRGNWVMTDEGNMWVSDAPWGWACYHYGRWTYNGYYGWVWIPGNEWAPAWVNWRSGSGYYGWAPMGPDQYPGSYYEYPVNYWVFVTPQCLYRPNVYNYYQPGYSENYYHQTTYINETIVINGSSNSYYYGPRPEVIARETNQPVQVYHVSNSNAPGAAGIGGNSVSIYRPAVNRASANTARPENVVVATHPIGKPEAVPAAARTNQPAFREEMQKQNPAFRTPNNYSNIKPTAPPARNNEMQQASSRPVPQSNGNEAPSRPVNNRVSQQIEPSRGVPQNNEPQMNRNEPPARQNPPANRMQPQNNEPQMNRAEPQQAPQPANQPKQQSKRQQRHAAPPQQKKN